MTLPARPLAGPRLAAVLAAAGLAVAACGSSSPVAVRAPVTSPSAAPGPGGLAARGPAAFGTVAAVSGSDVEVQNPTSGQVTVHLTPATKVVATVSGTAADVHVGGCAAVQPVPPSGGTASPPATVPPGTPVTARAVTLSAATGGACTALLRGPGLGGPGRASAPPASGAPATPRPRVGGPRPAAGLITAVTSGGFTLRETGPGGATTSVTVTTTAQTSYTRTEPATPAAITVGSCLVAQGRADDTGAVTATTVTVRPDTGTGCSAGFGRREPGPGGAAASGGGNA